MTALRETALTGFERRGEMTTLTTASREPTRSRRESTKDK